MKFLAFLYTVRWQDLVDIIINSYILFRVYVLFQGTNAFRVLVGITSLWILQEVAASIGLILTSWAIRGITTAAAVISDASSRPATTTVKRTPRNDINRDSKPRLANDW